MSQESHTGQQSTGESTARAVGEMIPQPHGGALRNGGTNRGGSGRPPDEFKAEMGRIASSDEALAYLQRCALGEFGPKFAIAAQKYAAERKYGKPVQAIEVSGTDGNPVRTEIVFVKPSKSAEKKSGD